MGIKGTVRRSTDGDFIHANVDIDLIIAEETEWGCIDKPVEIFHIIEHFCLGRRRLHVFGRDSKFNMLLLYRANDFPQCWKMRCHGEFINIVNLQLS